MRAPARSGMLRRLLLGQALVLLAVGVTTWAVASLVGPPLFRDHLHQAGVPDDSSEQFHAEQAYWHATAISIAVAIAVAALTAFVVTVYLSRRVQHSLAEISAAAITVAEGRYDVQVTPPQLGSEFDGLAAAFNQMAHRLRAVESTRRRLFGDLAHEIRTPVAVLDAYLEAVEDGVKTLDARTVATLREQTGRLVRFSADAAALAQAEEAHTAITLEWVDSGQLVDAAIAAVADRFAAESVALTSHVDEAPRLWGDRQRLGQVLGNLLDNALRHTAAGGHVTLAVARHGSDAVFTVTDDGVGVTAEHLPHLFERFYRADVARYRDRGGAGIGLAIAKALTEAHGGQIDATSQGPGTGTTFTVTVPIQPPAAALDPDKRDLPVR
ncbi:histidine kinase [Mycolicibacterium acapulense]|uniref:histidine kinase n=1 Tax=Mycobacterium lehmannii TaxID=2048550 RepID=A0A124EQ01_9MYCO|nr:HAMP domain-containing sensor histidine kinase [Mycobacterium lehmannii]KUI05270.1 histidine kinase [Mycolicibacterium acapulense]KUI06216.1 histidine kinase [Mycolicibacterium acapulense]KUI13349.1 histidine kinase [Mycolicibacterium acapulense]KUI18816.1 histidine kinase [Mycobacterium lehmannii]